MNQLDPLMTLSEVADYLNVSNRTVTRMIARGEIRGTQVSRWKRVRRSDLLTYLEASATTHGGHP